MTKTILILAIAVAFVVGSVMTGTMAYATGDKNGKPFEALWDAIHALETAVSLDDDADSSNEDQTLSGSGEVVLGTTAAGDGGGTVTCADITGGAGLCDGNDAVDDADNDSSNELQTLSGTGSVDLSDGGGSVSCVSITGDASLCDGDDAVGATQQLVKSTQTLDFNQVLVGGTLPANCVLSGTNTVDCTLSCSASQVLVVVNVDGGLITTDEIRTPTGNSATVRTDTSTGIGAADPFAFTIVCLGLSP